MLDNLPATQLIPLGIPWLDLWLGGLTPGSVMLFLAPTGGGKTIMGTQMSYTTAARRQHAVYLTYDQDLGPDMKHRFFSLATGRSKDEYDRLGRNEPEVLQAALATIEVVVAKQHLHAFDLSGSSAGDGGVPEIAKLILQQTAIGQRPSLVVVDYLGIAAKRASRRLSSRAESFAVVVDEFARGFVQLCREEGFIGVLLEQLAAEQQQQPGLIRIDHSMAADCQSLGQYYNAAEVLPRGLYRVARKAAVFRGLPDRSPSSARGRVPQMDGQAQSPPSARSSRLTPPEGDPYRSSERAWPWCG